MSDENKEKKPTLFGIFGGEQNMALTAESIAKMSWGLGLIVSCFMTLLAYKRMQFMSGWSDVLRVVLFSWMTGLLVMLIAIYGLNLCCSVENSFFMAHQLKLVYVHSSVCSVLLWLFF